MDSIGREEEAGNSPDGPHIAAARDVEASAMSDLAATIALARAEFGIRCFWNTPVLVDPRDDARLVADRLRRYGGRRGWDVAACIDKAVAATAGPVQWR
ncbi:hypothetical protein [Methylobacterium oryzihabitans]|uniref:Uncharacterized protein n=1 Tax=Methylobacterium oryzihabitans TaxID=2499852 RepID=A0A437PGW4_9HYPH|nr:hypothetical protein [Methylobacterium oryzihabitans]RVU21513.1 hypothetical protein EOE48_00170 [Methylobacterium oryzihabitans]